MPTTCDSPTGGGSQSPLALERLVRNAGFGRGYQPRPLRPGLGLVYFLRTQHPQQFLTFIDLFAQPNLGEPAPAWQAATAFSTPSSEHSEPTWTSWKRMARLHEDRSNAAGTACRHLERPQNRAVRRPRRKVMELTGRSESLRSESMHLRGVAQPDFWPPCGQK